MSIYKWKKNGIPHRYRDLIRELAYKKNVKFEDNIFQNYKETDTTITYDKITTEQSNNKSNIHSFKFFHSSVAVLMLIFLLGGSLYFINVKYDLEDKIQNVWNTSEDLDSILFRISDDPDGPPTEDQLVNLLIGLKEMHDSRCRELMYIF